ncbi:S8 family serine peptidase [Thalassobaculum sp. OXR-137]|uniref:S8 family serine peptidase n=1 Tax=Thalassobaculum sp. OXR-137 TaxID=3100173 RepID=UPI002AC96D37|nr:S8 family serine peptidase [Thalassobaculum sp. OXR-137]WPZ34584.1 S8 family serine peptidase [Thalassobaculum sp. OXR-137]
MGSWSVGIVDSGVTNETEAAYGASVFARDYYGRDTDTDGGRLTSHGSKVAQAAEQTNSYLDRLDLQISNDSGSRISSFAIRDALNDVNRLASDGWNIGAINMSFGGVTSSWTSYFRSQIAILHDQRIYCVASAGNSGTRTYLEYPHYPARFGNVLSVGSHDGQGNPSWFSQNYSGGVHVLADGENFPNQGDYGTSYSAPQVTATVATMQALVEASTGTRLTFSEVVDGLQQGGHAPRSGLDTADSRTSYYLLDHQGAVNYVLSTHVDPSVSWLEYIASYSDLEAVFGRDTAAARSHFIHSGVWEGRFSEFDGLEYLASYSDLRAAFGTDRHAAVTHYLDSGRAEGRTVSFDADAYMAANPDIAAVVNGDRDRATEHWIANGAAEGRSPGHSGLASAGAAPEPIAVVAEGGTDFARTSDGAGRIAVGQSASGEIQSDGDRDWYAADLADGQTVMVHVSGAPGGGGSLVDADIYVYDEAGHYIAYDFDSGSGSDAQLAFTAPTSGTYYLEVDGHLGHTGSYSLSVAALTASAMDDLAAGIDATDREPASFEDLRIALLSDGGLATDPFGLL